MGDNYITCCEDKGSINISEDVITSMVREAIAEVEGVGGGEYYTPSSIVKTLVSILKPFENCRVYDPCCGSGGMFVQSEKFLEAHGGRRGHLSVYGQEANADTWKMAKINMAIRGIDADFGPYHDDTFANDLHPNLKADFIISLGPACETVRHLRNYNLTFVSNPLDWMAGYSLDTIEHLFKTNFKDYFEEIEDLGKGDGFNKKILDKKNSIISIHHFKYNDLKEEHYNFRSKMLMRALRMKQFIINSDELIFVSSWSEPRDKMYSFIKNMYFQLNKKMTFINIKNSSSGKFTVFKEYINENLMFVEYSFNDIHPKGYFRTIYQDPIWGYADAWERQQREADLVDSAVRFIQFMVPSDLNLDYNDDGFVDNIVFVINSDVEGWSELLWPHRTSLWDRVIYIRGKRVYDYNFQLARNDHYFSTSTLCHEMFHSLSAPDLYGYEEGGNDHVFVGKWDLMEQNATPPQNMDAYMKHKYGHWIDEIPRADTNGLYTIYPVASSKNSAYIIPLNDPFRPNEYLLLEYRQL